MPTKLRYHIASFDTDVPPGPIGIAAEPAGEEIAVELQKVMERDGYEVSEVDLGDYTISWTFTLRINESKLLVELFGAQTHQPIPWCVFVNSATGCLWFFKADPHDIVAGHHAVDAALRKVNLIRNVRWHEPGPDLGILGDFKERPE